MNRICLIVIVAASLGSASCSPNPPPSPPMRVPSPQQQVQRISIEQSIIGNWEHQFGPWKLEFGPGGQFTIRVGGMSSAGKYQFAAGGVLRADIDGGGLLLAQASINGDGDLILDNRNNDRETNVQIYGDNNRAIFVRRR